jgi:hypothetical protein
VAAVDRVADGPAAVGGKPLAEPVRRPDRDRPAGRAEPQLPGDRWQIGRHDRIIDGRWVADKPGAEIAAARGTIGP